MKKKRGVKCSWILIVLILILGACLFYDYLREGSPRGGPPSDSGGGGEPGSQFECNDSSDCPPRIETYCLDNDTLCTFITYYVCIELENSSKCVPMNCDHWCNITCEFGCKDGECLGNLSDLIVLNITEIDSSASEMVFLAVFVKNIGDALAPETVTKVFNVDTSQEYLLDTPSLSPGEITFVEMRYAQPLGTTYQINATADYLNDVEESNEENNEGTIIIQMPDS